MKRNQSKDSELKQLTAISLSSTSDYRLQS